MASDEEDCLPEETALVHNRFLDDIARDEMDRVHSEYLRNRKSSSQPASGSSQPVVVEVDAINNSAEKGPVVDLCKSDEPQKNLVVVLVCPFHALCLLRNKPGWNPSILLILLTMPKILIRRRRLAPLPQRKKQVNVTEKPLRLGPSSICFQIPVTSPIDTEHPTAPL